MLKKLVWKKINEKILNSYIIIILMYKLVLLFGGNIPVETQVLKLRCSNTGFVNSERIINRTTYIPHKYITNPAHSRSVILKLCTNSSHFQIRPTMVFKLLFFPHSL